MVGTLLLMQLLHCRNNKNKQGSCSGIKTISKLNFVGNDDRKHSDRRRRLNKETISEAGNLSLCRVCLLEQGTISIFDSENNQIAEALRTFGGIEVSLNDDFPKNICKACFSLIQGAILLRETALKSDKILKKPVKQLKRNTRKKDIVFSDNNDNDDSMEAGNDFEEEFNYTKEVKYKTTKTDEKTQYCKRCDLRFDDLEKYKDHLASEDHENKKTTCKYCHKEVKVIYLTRHIHENHDPDNLFICDTCGKVFTVKTKFRHHKMLHSNELPFKCNICPYRGRFKEALKMHMRSHLKEKPYKCPHCPTRTFANKSNLSRHMMTNHTKEKNFKCDTCGRAFYFKRELEQHFKVDHSGIKDHVCDICFKAFGYRHGLLQHQLKVHKREKIRDGGGLPLYMRKEFQENQGD